MTNNDEDKLNNDSLLRYSGGTSYTSRSSAVSDSEGTENAPTSETPPVQFESRRARRMSETGLIPQVPPSVIKTVPSIPVTSSGITSSEKTHKVPELSQTRAAMKSKNRRPIKEYWGGTAIMFSLIPMLVAQLVVAIALVGYIFIGYINGSIKVDSSGADANAIIASVPWLLILANGLTYVAWFGSMWWVSKYRSGVQRGKKFWAAFKDNFRLNDFKYTDIAWGVGAAVAMFGVQLLITKVLPELVPSLKTIIQEADNTGPFKDIEGIWFYIIGFGLVGLLGPIMEELFFRGFLLRGLENHFSYKNSGRNMDVLEDGLGEQVIGIKSMFVSYRAFAHKHRYLLAGIITSILFGLAHYQLSEAWWITCLVTGLLGATFATLTIKLNRLYPAIIGHVVHNTVVFALLALSK